jgi:hypothetical protein
LPSFITAAPRIVVGPEGSDPQPVVEHVEGAAAEASAPQGEGAGEARFPRGRRRRLRSPYGFHSGPGDDAPAGPVSGPGETPASD